jgi:hypothetical protein
MSDPIEKHDSIKKLVQIIDEYKVSAKEKDTCMKKAMITLRIKLEKGEIKEGEPLIIRNEKNTIALLDKDNGVIFLYKFEELDTGMLVKPEMIEDIIKHEMMFQKDIKSRPEMNDIGFFKHAHFGVWINFNATEFISEIKSFEEKSGEKCILKDCDVKTCKVKGRKYKRITFTNEKHIRGFSHVEFAFGTLIDGWTYLILPEKWKQIKEEVFSLVDYQETTYGSSTRYDWGGVEYKAEH